ncbi:MAG: OmcA/MtrC family decaheme c-type cytochrome [Deltaproteobacteria bacterium]|nr:MAG: OmcA/MtrC family decaheme c-type cytochrome [Deltaproteobacteria bacterium]
MVGPGLVLEILSAAANASDQLVVRFRVTDEGGRALDREGLLTVGPVDITWVFAVLDPATEKYQSLNVRQEMDGNVTVDQATGERDGTYQEVGPGEYEYTSSAVVPAGTDPTDSIRVAAYATRDFEGQRYVSNAVLDVTVTGDPAPGREIVLTENCNQCHNPLAAHGGRRRDTALCVTCHNPGSTDAQTGNTLDFPVLVHRIHMGAELPSVAEGPVGAEYAIVGYMNRRHTYAIRTGPNPGDVEGVHFPQEMTRCFTCHAGAREGDHAYTEINRYNCTTCHDNVAFEDPPPPNKVLHPAGPQDDATCAGCHGEGMSADFREHHLDDHEWAAAEGLLPGLSARIESVSGVVAGGSPTVTFRVQDSSGNDYDISQLDLLRAVFSGPADDTEWDLSSDLSGAVQNADGSYTVTVSETLPDTLAAGVVVRVGLEGFQNFTLDRDGESKVVREAFDNPVVYYAVGDTPATYEATVATAVCETCHGDLAAHGGFRREVEHCLGCHHENKTDAAMRPSGTPVSVDFKVMIHKIHRGEHLEQKPYVIYGYGNVPHDFSDVRFPGRLNACRTCHVNEAWQEPSTAVCTSCHDSPATAAHAEINTSASGVESCAVCHGEDAEFAVAKVHQDQPE